ncbi:MAG: hypothetical protein BVN32_02210 [Proteobacteria bacterium ST_bin14]|nr:MAG: hypothetical protein BVN32_02210 [Proteobacteria bacterium ST_bin14]
MSDSFISDFQVTIVRSTLGMDVPDGEEAPFAVNRHSRGSGAVIDRIDELEGIWDQVITKLTSLAAQSQVAAVASQFELDEIEFNVGIEAGLSVGLVTKGNASVSVKFSRKKNER